MTLFASTGTVMETTGTAPTETIWREIMSRPGALLRFEHAGGETIATPVGAGRDEISWLAISGGGQRMPRLARAAARAAAPLLVALSRLEAQLEVRDRAARAAAAVLRSIP